MRKSVIAAAAALPIAIAVLSGCATDAEVASYNLSQDAEAFNVNRSIVFYNGITGEIMLNIEGRCSIQDQENQLEVTCRVGENEYTKDFLGLSDNVTYYAHQLDTIDVSVYHHKVVIKPENFVPGFEFESGKQ